LGVLCGAGSALFWSFGFVAARHGVLVGLSPLVLSLHRFVWSGLILLPFMAASGLRDLGGVAGGMAFC
jgi:drug/metabolite transporter (DMT)-like permease